MRYTLLEPLRGLAALWVFSYHYPFSEAFQTRFPYLAMILRLGHLGVPMFFVLSGFCITASARNSIDRGESAGRFLYRRLKRIYPTFWFSILVVISIPFIIELISSFKTGQYKAPSAANLNYGFLNYGLSDWILVTTLTQVFVPIADATNLQYKFTTISAVYWTLAIEVQFYLVVTVAVYFRRCYTVLLGVTLVSLPFLFLPATKLIGVFLPYWPMFAVGVLLHGHLERKIGPSRFFRGATKPLSGICLLAMMIAFLLAVQRGWPINEFVFALAFALVLFFASEYDAVFVDRVLASKWWLVRVVAQITMMLGAMSYSLYLIHSRIQYLVIQILRQILPSNTVLLDVVAIVCTCVICYFFYWICERHFMSSRPQNKEHKTPPPENDVPLIVSPAASPPS